MDKLGGELRAEFDEGWIVDKASFDVEADQLNILDVPVASLKAQGNYEPSRLEVQNSQLCLNPVMFRILQTRYAYRGLSIPPDG